MSPTSSPTRVGAALAFLLGLAACGPKYPKCDTDDQCAEQAEVCVGGTCQSCRDEKQCAAGQLCKGGRCEAKPECAADGDCKDNKVCKSGACRAECAAEADCGAGQKCMASRCVDKLACVAPSDCAAGTDCVSGRCQGAIAVSRGMCVLPKLRFDFNESVLTEEARRLLAEAADCIKTKGGTIVIEGHCDERGTEEYNLALGDRRAQTVVRYLATLGVDAGKLRAISKGELEPADARSTEDAWAQNRRAEILER